MSMKKDKHDVEQDTEDLAKLPSFSIVAKPMSTFSKLVNLAINKGELLHSFSYSNASITIVLENGKTLSAPLRDLFVEFEKISGMLYYRVNSNCTKVKFYQTTNISNKEWEAISSVLCLAGSTRGRSMFSKEAKMLGLINVAAKAIKAIS